MVEDPFVYGQIAAANALSDIYAMGGTPVMALNMVCFPEKGDLNTLGEIMRGGQAVLNQAQALLVGGHSIYDDQIKYGLSVTGLVNPKNLYRNTGAQVGDRLVLTKLLGVGILCTAYRQKALDQLVIDRLLQQMTTLNRVAAEVSKDYEIHACTDVTGFGFLGHLKEMLGTRLGARIDTVVLPMFAEAIECANRFYITAAGQRNRRHVGDQVIFHHVPFGVEEVLFDPQTSGGLLFAVAPQDEKAFVKALQACGVAAEACGTITAQVGRIDVF